MSQETNHEETQNESWEETASEAAGCSRRLISMIFLGTLGMALCGLGGVMGQILITGNSLETRIQPKIENKPILVDQIGKTQSVSFSLTETLRHENKNTFVFDIEGTNGTGKLIVEYDFVKNEPKWIKYRSAEGEEMDVILPVPETDGSKPVS